MCPLKENVCIILLNKADVACTSEFVLHFVK